MCSCLGSNSTTEKASSHGGQKEIQSRHGGIGCQTGDRQGHPKARDVSDVSKLSEIIPSLPWREVLDKLGQHGLVVGVDIETADWTHRKNSLRKGQFGFHTMCDADVFDQRIVQLGWFIKDLTNNASAEERGEMIVQPDGFEISAKATKLH